MNLSAIKILVRIGLVIISITIGYGICEILSRIIYKIDLPYFINFEGKSETLNVPNNELEHATKPNFDGWIVGPEFKNKIQTNRHGFRGRQDFLEMKKERLRIMALGDSFTFGVGVEENEVYIKRTAEILQKELSIPVKAINLGVPSYGTIQEFILFQKYKYLKPDILVLGFFARDSFSELAGNDLVDNYSFYHEYIKGNVVPKREHLSFMRTVRMCLLKSSNLFRWAELYLGWYIRKISLPEKQNLEHKKEAWKITSDYLLKFDTELQDLKIKCFLLWIPFPLTAVRQDHSVANNIASLRLMNIILIDPLEAMKPNPMNYYYRKFDQHWNAEGHNLAAGLLVQKIIESGIICKADDSSTRTKH
jgi:hypothetical protein